MYKARFTLLECLAVILLALFIDLRSIYVALSVDHFTPRTATFEVRYSAAFLLWDHSGGIWNEVKKRYPELTVEEAAPNQVRVTVDEKTQAIVMIDKTYFTVSAPKGDLRELRSLAEVFFPVVFAHLDVSALSRVGLRVMYDKRFEERKAAADFLAPLIPIPKLKGKYLNVDGKVLDPEIAFRYEDDVLGFAIRVKVQQNVLNLTVPIEFQDVIPRKTERSFAILDVDYYAHGITPITSFDGAALIEGWLHLIRRDIGKLV